ncbi:MAG: glycoside hydrolase family 88 protein [Spirochaetaceae bacterium]|jgi:unsaturated rhamnogalacturonyl hydrolase|nr:glycoside hydrolase family 88 protein [Spirochaetaceae bacterium]
METIDTTRPAFERMALSVMKRYPPDKVRWHYEHGLMLQSVWAVGKAVLNGEENAYGSAYGAWVTLMYDTKIDGKGRIQGYRADEFNLDQINAGKALFDLWRETGNRRYRVAIETLHGQMERQPRTRSGGFWHKKIYPYQMWLDGVYMAEPFNARYIREFGGGDGANGSVYADVVRQFTLMAEKARDPKTGLLYHAWDESREQCWADPETGCSPHFWGRALGWYCMALVDTLDIIPHADVDARAPLTAIARSLVGPILAVQDAESGLWYQVLDQGGREKNYLESSASAMFCYFFYKVLNNGLAEKDAEPALREAAVRAWDGLLRLKVRDDAGGDLHLTDICAVAGLGGTPYRDGSYDYYVGEPVATDDFKGVGPFILAGIEREADNKRDAHSTVNNLRNGI